MDTISKLAVVDIETTGPSFSEGDRIIQIGAIIIEQGEIVAEHSMLINPERHIPTHIQNLTGIKQNEVDKAPTFNKVAALWAQRLKDCVFIAHNLAFDLPFIEKSFEAANITFKVAEAFDSEWIARIMLPTGTGFNLSDLATDLSIQFENAHDAQMDALVTTKILSDLALAFLQLPLEAQSKLAQLSRYLKNSERLFFEQAEAFVLKQASPTVPIAAPNEEAPSDTLAEWIYQQLSDKKRIIVSTNRAPISLMTRRQLIQKLPQPSIIISEDMDYLNVQLKKAYVLRGKSEFLSQAGLNWLMDNFHHLILNQNELLQLLGVYQWSFITQTGLLDELNSDFMINVLFEKYVPSHFLWRDEAYFSRYQSLLSKAHYLLVSPEQIYKLQAFMRTKLYHETQYLLYIDSIEPVIQHLYHLNRLEIPLSQNFIELQNFYESLAEMNETPAMMSQISSPMVSTLKLMNQLLISLIEQFKEQFASFSKVQVNRYLVCDDELNHYLQEKLIQLKIQFNVLIQYSSEVSPAFKAYLSQVLDKYHRVLQQIVKPGDFTIKAVQFNHNFFHLVLEFNHIDEVSGFSQILSSVERIGIIDDNFIASEQNVFNINHSLDNFARVSIPDLYYAKKTVNVPFGYMLDSQLEDEIHEFEKMSYFQEKAAIAQCEFLQDNLLECKNKILIITSNRNAVEFTYNLLSSNSHFNDYQLLAEGVTGSARKVLRKFKENDLAIAMISRHNLTIKQIPIYAFDFDIFIHTLPFTSQEHPISKKLKLKHDWDNSQLFDHYLIAKMLGDFSQSLLLMTNYYPNSSLYLFDERIYTKYYSSQVREYFERWINFEIID